MNRLLLRETSAALKEAHKTDSLFTWSPSVSYQSTWGDTWSALPQEEQGKLLSMRLLIKGWRDWEDRQPDTAFC